MSAEAGGPGGGALGLYVHIPYCSVRCSYCDFYLRPGRDPDLNEFVLALRGEIERTAREHPGRIADTLHFGGGTPSLLEPSQVAGVIASARHAFALGDDAEIALEANPEDLDRSRLEGFALAGVNRLSIGVQSLDDRVLRLMRRPHDARRAVEAVGAARRSAVRSLGVDLMLGFPLQDPAGSIEDLGRLLDLGVDHASIYLLELHEKTRLGTDVARGRLAVAPDDDAARLYEGATALLERRGLANYEISNFARPAHRSRHNLKYWTDADYLGFGPSAHSYAGARRWSNAPDLRGYLSRARESRGALRLEEEASGVRRAVEALVAGLRLCEGVDLDALRGRYGEAFEAPGDEVIDELSAAGLVERAPGRLRLTRRGRLLSNEVLERLLPAAPQLT